MRIEKQQDTLADRPKVDPREGTGSGFFLYIIYEVLRQTILMLFSRTGGGRRGGRVVGPSVRPGNK